MRVMTDVSAERYWTVIAQIEVESLEQWAAMTHKAMEINEFQEVMKDSHSLIDHGRREIDTIEG